MKKENTDPVLLQIAADLANLEARVGQIMQSAAAQQGALESRMRAFEARYAADYNSQQIDRGEEFHITVQDGGQVVINRS